MDLRLVIVLVFMSVAMCPQTDAGWIRFRRIVREVGKVWKPLCTDKCPRGCTALTFGIGCKFICRNVCGRKKRYVDTFHDEAHITFLPRNFDFYDLNDDGFVLLIEFASTFGHNTDEFGLVKAFNQTDVDQDGRLTEEELLNSEVFVFAPGTNQAGIPG